MPYAGGHIDQPLKEGEPQGHFGKPETKWGIGNHLFFRNQSERKP